MKKRKKNSRQKRRYTLEEWKLMMLSCRLTIPKKTWRAFRRALTEHATEYRQQIWFSETAMSQVRTFYGERWKTFRRTL